MSTKQPLRPAALRLTADIYDALKSSPLGISEEARKRIERTFLEDSVDPQTRLLTAAITRLAASVRNLLGVHWHQNQRASEVLLTAVTVRLASLRTATVSDSGLLISPEDDLKTIGRILGRTDEDRQLGLDIAPALTSRQEPEKQPLTIEGRGVAKGKEVKPDGAPLSVGTDSFDDDMLKALQGLMASESPRAGTTRSDEPSMEEILRSIRRIISDVPEVEATPVPTMQTDPKRKKAAG